MRNELPWVCSVLYVYACENVELVDIQKVTRKYNRTAGIYIAGKYEVEKVGVGDTKMQRVTCNIW